MTIFLKCRTYGVMYIHTLFSYRPYNYHTLSNQLFPLFQKWPTWTSCLTTPKCRQCGAACCVTRCTRPRPVLGDTSSAGTRRTTRPLARYAALFVRIGKYCRSISRGSTTYPIRREHNTWIFGSLRKNKLSIFSLLCLSEKLKIFFFFRG